ncbi:MAG: hypothetical protein H6995_04445 [Pseudomonadales bacterium]|nr:hypothetical protein [Pseudomonadales bacterium]
MGGEDTSAWRKARPCGRRQRGNDELYGDAGRDYLFWRRR